jgi:hypothetical protein
VAAAAVGAAMAVVVVVVMEAVAVAVGVIEHSILPQVQEAHYQGFLIDPLPCAAFTLQRAAMFSSSGDTTVARPGSRQGTLRRSRC